MLILMTLDTSLLFNNVNMQIKFITHASISNFMQLKVTMWDELSLLYQLYLCK